MASVTLDLGLAGPPWASFLMSLSLTCLAENVCRARSNDLPNSRVRRIRGFPERSQGQASAGAEPAALHVLADQRDPDASSAAHSVALTLLGKTHHTALWPKGARPRTATSRKGQPQTGQKRVRLYCWR